jgi:hypothetical protein
MLVVVSESTRSCLGHTAAVALSAALHCKLALLDPSAAVGLSAAVHTHTVVEAVAIACTFPSNTEMCRQRFHDLHLGLQLLCFVRIPPHKRVHLVGST